MSNDCIFLIDTFSLMFQVFHAIPPMTGTEGQPTNAVFGFTRDLLAILERKPSHLMCAFDSPEPSRRNEIYEAYKANRTEMPEDLRPQIPLLKELLAGFRIPAVECPTWEADDVIATVTAMATARGMDVVIVSADKDARQLLGPNVKLFNCRKNEFLDESGLLADWGVRADQVVDYQSLVGDTSDNVPGVPKIGPKTARALLEQFGTLDEVLKNADKASGRIVQKNLTEFADQARVCRELVRLRTDLPLPFDLESARIREPDREALFRLFTRLGFRRYSDMMRDSATPAASTESPTSVDADNGRVTRLRSTVELQEAIAEWNKASPLCLDTQINGVLLRDKRLQAAAVGDPAGRVWLLDFSQRHDGPLHDMFLQWCGQYSGELILAEAKPLLHVLLNADLLCQAVLFDVSVADYLLDAGARSHDLSEVADRHTVSNPLAGVPPVSRRSRQKTMFDDEQDAADTGREQQERAEVMQKRLDVLSTVSASLKAALSDDQLTALYENVERPLISVLAQLEHTGIAVDVPELRQQSQKALTRIEQLTVEIYAAAECEFNVDSPKQLSDILFQKLKLPVLKKTKTGASTDQEVLEQLALVHPLPAKIIERRHLTKLRGTYLDALPALVHPVTGRIHATFHQTVAATGRLSSSDPNLQNIPIRTSEGKQIRRAFRAGPADWKLVCADYSQIELRFLAHYSQDPALMEAFREGLDIHAAVAADVFHVPVVEVTSEQRRVAKAVNFGVIYGQSPFGLATALGIETSEAARFIEDYFARFAGVAGFCEQVLQETDRTGFVRTIMNRRRAISGIRSTTGIQRNMPERTAINTVLQGSAADLIKMAMIEVSRQLSLSRLRAALLLQIHDELVFEVHPDDQEQLVTLVVPAMQNAMSLKVPLVVDVTSGANWLDQADVVPSHR